VKQGNIKERILGAWEMVSFLIHLPDGRTLSGLGRGGRGSIVYTADNYVSVNLTRGDRPRPLSDTIFHELPDDAIGQICRGFMSYSGPYEVHEDRQLLIHHYRFCLDPLLVGTLQERYVRFDGDLLELSVREAEGVSYPSTITWRRP